MTRIGQGDASTDEEDTTTQVPTSVNLDKERLVISGVVTSIAPQFLPKTTSPTQASPQFFTILDDEVSSVKDFVIFGLLARERNMGVESSGSGG